MMKQMLQEKILFLDAVALTKRDSVGNTSVGNTWTGFQGQNRSGSIVSQLLGYFWLSSMLVPKVRWQDMSFMYNGKPLDDDHHLQDYLHYMHTGQPATTQPQNAPITMHVSMRLYGGCFMISASVLGLIITAIIGSTCTCGLSLIAVPFLLPLLFVLPFFCL
jgi:hypothetical protein